MKKAAILFLSIMVSTSLRADRPTFVPHHSMWHAGGRTSPKMPLIQSIFGILFLDSINRNFYSSPSGTLDPSFGPINWHGAAGEVDDTNITFIASHANIDTVLNNFLTFWTDGVTCGSGTGFVAQKKNKGAKTLSLDTVPSTECQLLYNECYAYDNNQLWQMAYDTGMKFVETCPNDPYVIYAFTVMSDAAQHLGNYGAVRSNYYAWLKSVLYLNTTDFSYFCACVYALSGEIPIPNSVYPDTGYDWGLAMYNWMIKNTNCDSPTVEKLYYSGRQDQIQDWQNASGAYKLDTILPPLDSIDPGLQELLDKHFLYASVSSTPVPGILSNATAYPNPTGDGTIISFSISQQAYVKIELFDVLGKEASSYGYESLLEPGNKSVSFSLQGLPSGTYYARIITAYGEVQTVKLVKE